MKKKNIFLSIFLSLVCMVSVFGFWGCGESTIDKIGKNFELLDQTYAEYASVFVEDNVLGFETKHKVDFGEKVNGYVESGREQFAELDELYNVAFAISNEYIDQNRETIFILSTKEWNKTAKKELETLNKSISAYIKQIDEFVEEREYLVRHFENYEGLVGDNTSLTYLRRFKTAFGKLLEKNVEFSTNLANAVEATEIFDLLKSLEDPQESDTKIVKEFARAKMLHLFTDFKVLTFSNEISWNEKTDKGCKRRIDALMTSLDEQYETFKQEFVLSKKNFDTLTKQELSTLFDDINEFLLEAEAYSKALEGMNFYSLVVTYDNDLDAYLKKNKLAEQYFEKMEQFVSITLPSFMANLSKTIYTNN